MTISQPSREVFVVDVPEVRDFAATFTYNFFVPDESLDDSGGIPENFLARQASEIDANFIQHISTRAPRYVIFNFTHPKLGDVGRGVADLDVRENVFDRSRKENLIFDNLDKVITEDHFSSVNFISVNFHDAEIDEKIYHIVSGSFEQHTLEEESDNDISHGKAANKLHSLLPSHIKPQFLNRALSNPKKAHGTSFITTSAGSKTKQANTETRHKNVKTKTSRKGRSDLSLKSSKFFNRLGHVSTNVQINGKLFHDVVNRMIDDPHSPFGSDLQTLHQSSKHLQNAARQNVSLQVHEKD